MPRTISFTIDLAALRANLATVRRLVGPERKILACVKANAYGHGLVECARTLVVAGADALGVARLDEAMLLRDAGISGRIVLLGPESLDAADDLLARDVEVLVDSRPRLDSIVEAARRRGGAADIHLALDTGMGRFEAGPVEAWDLVERIVAEPFVRWRGVMTHFPVADGDREWTRDQWRRFDRITRGWVDRGIRLPARHAANSAGIVFLPEAHADMVRPGIMLYGLLPSDDTPEGLLAPVLRWTTIVAALHRHEPGETIGYGRTFSVARPMLVATLPVGYGDGLPWAAANRGHVLVRRCRAPIVGRISMDQTTVDVTEIPGVVPGDEVVIIGAQGTARVTAEDWARAAGTINYEITTRLMARVPRVVVDT